MTRTRYNLDSEVIKVSDKCRKNGTAVVLGDAEELRAAIMNLVDNAVKYSANEKRVDVWVMRQDERYVAIQVRDHGIGIAPEQQTKIFERFERAAEQRSGGFGIGLWIVRNICAAMGGTVSVESTVGEGACFTVMLPRHLVRHAVDETTE